MRVRKALVETPRGSCRASDKTWKNQARNELRNPDPSRGEERSQNRELKKRWEGNEEYSKKCYRTALKVGELTFIERPAAESA